MKRKILTLLAFSAIALATQASAFEKYDSNYGASFKENLKKQIQKEMRQNVIAQQTRDITPVTIKSRTNSTSQADSAKIPETNLLSSKEVKQTVDMLGESTKIFGGNSNFSAAAIKRNTIHLASGGGGTTAAGATSIYSVPVACGSKEFDDVVKNKFGVIDINKNYIDINGKTCRLSKKYLYVYLPYKPSINNRWKRKPEDINKWNYKWVRFPSNTQAFGVFIHENKKYHGRNSIVTSINKVYYLKSAKKVICSDRFNQFAPYITTGKCRSKWEKRTPLPMSIKINNLPSKDIWYK